MKHKNAEMIIAKANNTELVVLVQVIDPQNESGSYWAESSLSALSVAGNKFFLCLPQHKEAVLAGLNGEDFQVNWRNGFDGDWYLDCDDWRCDDIWYMLESHESRIKPNKEKRWIGYCASGNQTLPHPQSTKELAVSFALAHYKYPESDWQFIEIEVEV